MPTTQDEAAKFQEAIEFFIRACPGPPIAERGLRLVAYQPVRGVPGLDPSATGFGSENRGYFASVVEVADRLNCRPAYLSQSAKRLGYSYSRALRWLRFCHGIALRSAGNPCIESAWRSGFSDPSGWTRFTKALVGKSPKQLPRLPLEYWVRRAIEDVYLDALGHDPTSDKREMNNDNAIPTFDRKDGG